MNQDQLVNTLTRLTGQLQATGKEEERLLEEAIETLAGTLLQQDPATLSNNLFEHEKSDLLFSDKVDERRLGKIREIAAKVMESKPTEELRAFLRDTPVRSTQL